MLSPARRIRDRACSAIRGPGFNVGALTPRTGSRGDAFVAPASRRGHPKNEAADRLGGLFGQV
jgi:hypothetical protein